MKRSEINKCIREFEAILNEHKFVLPPFLHFTPEEWAKKGHEYDEIRDNALGWDITEFYIQPGTGYALIGEVSMCNDDNTDNRFLEASGRFPSVEEDEAPYRLLCAEYPPAKD